MNSLQICPSNFESNFINIWNDFHRINQKHRFVFRTPSKTTILTVLDMQTKKRRKSKSNEKFNLQVENEWFNLQALNGHRIYDLMCVRFLKTQHVHFTFVKFCFFEIEQKITTENKRKHKNKINEIFLMWTLNSCNYI